MQSLTRLRQTYNRLIGKADSLTLLRSALGLVFIWFGALKVAGLSPAEGMAFALVSKVTSHPSWAHPLYLALAWMEVLIGVLFFWKKALRYAVKLLFLHMPLTFMPLLFLPQMTFVSFPLVPSMEGQYIIKNLVFIAAGVLLGQAALGSSSAERSTHI